MRLMCNFLRSLRGPVFAALLTIVLIAAVTAQTPKASSLKGQVLDPSGSVVPGATVMLQQPAGGAVKSVTSDSLGKFSVVGLTAGPYNIVVKKKGFAVYQMQSFPVSGDGSIDIQLAVASSVQEMTVNDDRAHVEVSPDQNASALSLKGSDLDALSDDPDELQDDLEALAGPSAGPNGGQIYIDGFSGGTLPPKASIREVRVNSNPFSPEYDRLGYGRIEIFTKPGMDQFRGQVSLNFNDNAFNARNPFLGSTDKPSYQSRQYNGNLAGPLTKKMSFTFDFERRSIDEYGIEIGQQLDPNSLLPVSFSNAIPTPLTRTSLIPKIDMTLNDKNNLTIRYHWTDNSNTNSGVSGFNLASKAVNTQSYDNTIQATETAVLNSRAVTETRFMYDRSKSNSNALSSAPALSVSDAFNSGGSTVGQAWNRQNYYELSNVTTYTAGVHTLKWGGRMRVSDSTDYSPSNFNGSFSFTGGQAALLDAQDQPIVNADGSYVMGQESSLERYRRTLAFQQLGYAPALIRALGGGATTFTMAGGNPLAAIDQTDVGIFVSDDWRVRPTFTLSLGLRYENQTNIDNMADFAPRLGFAWAIGGGKNKVAKTVIRGGAGLFYDRVSSSVALAEFRYNGTTQQQYVVPNPDFFPNIPTLSTLATDLQPSSITKGYAGLVAPRIAQTGLSVERQLPKNTTATVTWAFSRGMHYLLTRDINAPLADGTYPLAQQYQSNQVMLYESAGLFTQNQLIVNVNSRMSKKVSLFGFYTLGYANGNSDGGSPMNQYDLRSEWGPTRWDTRHRFFIGGSITAPLKVVFSPFITGASGSPFNIVTGNDFNNDQIYNARPAFATDPSAPGVVATSYGLFNINPQPGDKIIPRNYGRGPAQFNLNLRMARTWGFGKTKEGAAGAGGPGGPGGGAFAGMGRGPRGGGPGGPGGMFGGADTGRRFNLTASVSARNLLNRENFASPESNLGSPLFGQSLALQSGFGGAASVYNRRVDMQLRLTF